LGLVLGLLLLLSMAVGDYRSLGHRELRPNAQPVTTQRCVCVCVRARVCCEQSLSSFF